MTIMRLNTFFLSHDIKCHISKRTIFRYTWIGTRKWALFMQLSDRQKIYQSYGWKNLQKETVFAILKSHGIEYIIDFNSKQKHVPIFNSNICKKQNSLWIFMRFVSKEQLTLVFKATNTAFVCITLHSKRFPFLLNIAKNIEKKSIFLLLSSWPFWTEKKYPPKKGFCVWKAKHKKGVKMNVFWYFHIYFSFYESPFFLCK